RRRPATRPRDPRGARCVGKKSARPPAQAGLHRSHAVSDMKTIILTMKIFVRALAFLILLTQAWGGSPVTLDEFKKLTPQERQKAIDTASPESKPKLEEWDWRVEFGEDAWTLRQQVR